jgi:hypothetical protein
MDPNITDERPLTPQERADAVAIASLLGVEPHDGFQHAAAFAARLFASNVIDRTRPEDNRWRDVLGRIAEGPASAAEIIARRGSLPDWQAEIITGFLQDVDCCEPPAIGDAITMTRTYQRLADQARGILDQTGKRGRRADFTLNLFVVMFVGILGHRDKLERLSKPGPFVEGLATALAQAILKTRAEIADRDDLSAEHRKAALGKLDAYDALTDDALRKRIRAFLAVIREAEDAADANRAKARI